MSDGPNRAKGATPSICVYCGARVGADPAFDAAARAFGAGLAAARLRLVYGAGDLGLMGAVAEGCLNAGGAAFGIIPQGLWEREIQTRQLPHVCVTENLHQRKAMMLQNADAVAVLPGGIGTLDEAVECVSWRQIGLHDKPIVFVDVAGYWGPLLDLFDHMARSGFLHPGFQDTFEVADGPEEAVRRLQRHTAAIRGGD